MTKAVRPMGEALSPPKLFRLGLQPVPVTCAGSVAAPSSSTARCSWNLPMSPSRSRRTFSPAAPATLIRSFGATQWFGIRILAGADSGRKRNTLFIVTISPGTGMIPLVAPTFKQWMPGGIHPLIESGILLASVAAVSRNAFFDAAEDATEAIKAAASNAEH